MTSFPSWAPKQLVKFYVDHLGFLRADRMNTLSALLSRPEMKAVWKRYAEDAPGREQALWHHVDFLFHDSVVKTIAEELRAREELDADLEKVKMTLEKVMPGLLTSNGKPLVDEIAYAQRKISLGTNEDKQRKATSYDMAKKVLSAFSALPERKPRKGKRVILVKGLAMEFMMVFGASHPALIGRVMRSIDDTENLDTKAVHDILNGWEDLAKPLYATIGNARNLDKTYYALEKLVSKRNVQQIDDLPPKLMSAGAGVP